MERVFWLDTFLFFMGKAHELADKIKHHDKVDAVRAEEGRIEVFETVEKNEREMSKEILEHTKEILEDSLYVPEVSGWLDTESVSSHTKPGDRTQNPAIEGGKYQLKKSYVR